MERIGIMEELGHACETVLGIVLAATPVALWVAWSPALLIWVLLTAAACSALLVLLSDHLPRSEAQDDSARSWRDKDGVPGEIVEEVHRLFPMIYHHSGRNSPRFRQAMARMARWIDGSGGAEPPR